MTESLDEKVQKSLRYSIIDGMFYSIKIGMGTSAFAPYAIFLQANDTQIGLLGTLPQMLGSWIQLFSYRLLLLCHSRQWMVVGGVFFQALSFLPILLTFWLGSQRIYYLLLWISLYWIAGMIIGPVWSSWMGDLIPDSIRGSYFGRRQTLMEIASFSSMLVGGYLIESFSHSEIFHDEHDVYLGFAAVFTLALIARMISCFFLTKKYDPPYTPTPIPKNEFTRFLQHLTHSNYGIFVLLMCLMNCSIYVSAPYFAPYMLKELQVGYFTYNLINAVVIMTKCVLLPYWGKLCDQFGTRKVMVLSGLLMPLCPILWLFQGPLWYYILVQIYAGIVWGGWEISVFNIAFDLTDREHRVTHLAYYSILNGTAIFIGGLLGAYLMDNLGIRYTTIFFISGILRYIVFFSLVRKIHEVRPVPCISYPQLLLQLFASLPLIHKVHLPVSKNSAGG